jgi:hypothetical protein
VQYAVEKSRKTIPGGVGDDPQKKGRDLPKKLLFARAV